MNEIHVNTTTAGSQYWQKHVEIVDGHILAWVSSNHKCVFGQKFDKNFKKVNSEFIVADTAVPKEFDLFKTQEGFSILYKSNDAQLYGSFFNNSCKLIKSHIKINTNTYSNNNNDAQKNLIEINNGYLITWSSPNSKNPNNKTDIYGQKLDKDYNKIGEQFVINEPNPEYSKYNPYTLKIEEGFLICWGMWGPNDYGIYCNNIFMKKFDNDCNQIGTELIINDNTNQNCRYNRIKKTKEGYMFIWMSGMTDVYYQHVDFEFDNIGSVQHINGTSFKNVSLYNKQILIGYYNNQQVKIKKYDFEGVQIDDEMTINDDPTNEYYDDGIEIHNLNNGYIVSWYSSKENDNCGIYAKIFLDESKNMFSIEPIIVDNNIRCTLFLNNIDNLLKDIEDIEFVQNKVSNWIEKGINLDNSTESLEKQRKTWIYKVEQNINFLKNLYLELKTSDDRINSSEKLFLDEEEFYKLTYKKQAEHICLLFKKLFNNLKEDIDNLNNVTQIVGTYNNLGIELGNAVETINEQKTHLVTIIKAVIKDFDKNNHLLNQEKDLINISN